MDCSHLLISSKNYILSLLCCNEYFIIDESKNTANICYLKGTTHIFRTACFFHGSCTFSFFVLNLFINLVVKKSTINIIPDLNPIIILFSLSLIVALFMN